MRKLRGRGYRWGFGRREGDNGRGGWWQRR